MRSEYRGRWWLPVAAFLLAGLIPLVLYAAPAGRKTMEGLISGTPMGTWMTLAVPSKTSPSTYQVDLANAKITEKGKAIKRYQLADGMKVRVTGSMRGTAFAAESVVVLGRSAPKKK